MSEALTDQLQLKEYVNNEQNTKSKSILYTFCSTLQ